jgi:hypothetical protein
MFSCTEFEPKSGRYLSENNLFYGLELDTENSSIKFYVATQFSQFLTESDYEGLQNWEAPYMASYRQEEGRLIVEDLRGDILPIQGSVQTLSIALNSNAVNCSCYDLREIIFGKIGRENMCESENIVFELQH